jgi:catechol 2,3-dioxygenase-like lactoylglutathione lyase family enzyme
MPFTAQSMEASLTVADVSRSVAWYRDVLGFTIDREHVRDGCLIAVSLSAGSIRILVTQDNGARGTDREKGAGFSLRFTTTQDIDTLAAAAKQAGAVFDTEPMDAMGFRIFRLRDPDGFRLVISSVQRA